VAIVRQEDGCYGQRVIGAPWLPDRLFGSAEWQSTATTEAWLAIWHLLTRGVVPQDRLYRGGEPYHSTPYQVFCPLDGVVVYDHHVSYPLLRHAEVIFLTGVGISPETQQAVARCVRRGALCVALPPLAPETVQRQADAQGVCVDGRGRWLLTSDFLSPTVRQAVAPVLPAADLIRYRFGDQEVTLRPVDGDPNRLAVDVRTTKYERPGP
jgi:hypothetical protein